MKKSCSSYGPIRSSVFCLICPFESAGVSSGLIGVSAMSMRISAADLPPFVAASVNTFLAAHLTRYLIKVFGTDALTAYIDIWSPL